MSIPDHQTLYEAYGRQLRELLDLLLAGEIVADRAASELLVRFVGASLRLHDLHKVDEHGWCSFCQQASRTWWRPWPKRITCTVHNALGFFFRQPDRFVLAALTNYQAHVRGQS